MKNSIIVFSIFIILFFLSCARKTVEKIEINMANQTVEINSRISRPLSIRSIYYKTETVKFKDLDSVIKLRELQLDTIYNVYKSLEK